MALPLGYRFGLAWYRNATDTVNDIDVKSGVCRSDDDTEDIVITLDPIVKRLDANWAVGTNAGGLDTGAKAASTWYWLWAIKRTDTGVSDILFSTSNTSPTMPTNYSKKRLIGCFRTNASSGIILFDTRWVLGGIYFVWLDPTTNGLDVNVANLGTSKTDYTLSFVPPFGDTLHASVLFRAHAVVAGGSGISLNWISNPDFTNAAPSDTASPLCSIKEYLNPAVFALDLYANRNAQISARANSANVTFKVQTLGFYWPGGV